MELNRSAKNKKNRFLLKNLLSLKLAMRFFGSVWFLTILTFAFFIVAGTNFFQTTIDKGPFQSDSWAIILIIDILVGIGTFLVFAVLLTVKTMKKKHKNKHKASIFRKLLNFLLFFVYLAVLPIYLLIKIWKPNTFISFVKDIKRRLNKEIFTSFVRKSLKTIPVLLILLPVWIAGYFFVGLITAEQLGLLTQPTSISGTGSMYPTFPKGEGEDNLELANQIVSSQGMFPYPNGLFIFGKRYFGHEIQRGDIVIVEDDKTRKITEEMYQRPSGWVKRVIALSGDTLEIRDGIVYLNNEPQKEPYVARARSTFGEGFLQECQPVTVPENSVFLMGDNRTGSGDSREVGFFNIDDINHALPWKNQEKDLSQNWRDTTNDLEESARIKLNKEEYLELLNKKREENNLKPLKYNEKLEKSAQKRGEVILEYNDFSFEATRSGYPMEKAVQEAGYYNTLWGEAPNVGYYEAEELLDNQLEFPESKDFIFDKRFQEIGIAEVIGEINGCPAHVIVQHFGGYVPPNYSVTDIKSWEELLSSLRNIQPGWNELKNAGDYYNRNKEKIDRITQIIDIRINKVNDIIGTMNANKWFSADQRAYIESGDINFSSEQNEIATFLNGQ